MLRTEVWCFDTRLVSLANILAFAAIQGVANTLGRRMRRVCIVGWGVVAIV